MKKIIVILLGIIIYCACQDDDERNWKKKDVKFSDFQDVRDMKTYKGTSIN